MEHILNPILATVEAIGPLHAKDANLRGWIDTAFGGADALRRDILADFFRRNPPRSREIGIVSADLGEYSPIAGTGSTARARTTSSMRGRASTAGSPQRGTGARRYRWLDRDCVPTLAPIAALVVVVVQWHVLVVLFLSASLTCVPAAAAQAVLRCVQAGGIHLVRRTVPGVSAQGAARYCALPRARRAVLRCQACGGARRPARGRRAQPQAQRLLRPPPAGMAAGWPRSGPRRHYG